MKTIFGQQTTKVKQLADLISQDFYVVLVLLFFFVIFFLFFSYCVYRFNQSKDSTGNCAELCWCKERLFILNQQEIVICFAAYKKQKPRYIFAMQRDPLFLKLSKQVRMCPSIKQQ